MKTLKQLLGFCAHKWKVVNQWEFIATYDGKETGFGTIYVMQCEHCGKLKKEKVSS